MTCIKLKTYGDYSVIVRVCMDGNITPVEPFVVAYKYNGTDWEHGHYFKDVFSAINHARTIAFGVPHPERLNELATKLLQYVAEEDPCFLEDECDLSTQEAEYFGVEDLYSDI